MLFFVLSLARSGILSFLFQIPNVVLSHIARLNQLPPGIYTKLRYNVIIVILITNNDECDVGDITENYYDVNVVKLLKQTIR